MSICREVEAGASGVQSHLQLHNEFKSRRTKHKEILSQNTKKEFLRDWRMKTFLQEDLNIANNCVKNTHHLSLEDVEEITIRQQFTH